MKPGEIEKLSFQIIDEEAGKHDLPADQWSIIRRMIHTSADFDYLKTARIHPSAIKAGIKAIEKGCTIITDTHMAASGITRPRLDPFNCNVTCLINDPKVVLMAKEKEITRAKAAVEAAREMITEGIYVVGNAPTALIHLLDIIEAGKAAPSLIVGVPVGFVNAAESKERLIRSDEVFITNHGRKGGSNIAASIVNALSVLALKKRKALPKTADGINP